MGDRNHERERIVPEIVDRPFAAQARALADQAQALANQAQALVASNNDVDQAEKSVFAYKEIANLHDINLHYPIHKLALEDWGRREQDLSNSISLSEGRSAELTSQIYNMLGLFAVFLGFVLSAVSQLTETTTLYSREPSSCEMIWFPIVLTVFATVATIVGILHKFTSLHSFKSTIHKQKQAKIEFAKRASCLRREGPQKFKFHEDTDNSKPATEANLSWKNCIYVIVSLVLFTCIIIIFYFIILCNISDIFEL